MKTTLFKADLDRRSLLAAACALPIVAWSAGSASAAKLAQTAVGYQTSPKDGKQCSDCALFVAPNSCKTVDGEILPDGWCRLWVKKPS